MARVAAPWWGPRGVGAGLLVVAAAAALTGCSTPPVAPPPSPWQAGSAATFEPDRPSAPDAGITGPVAPSHLVVRSWTCLMCIFETGTMVFDDGLVLRAPDGVHVARQLTPEGLEWVRARLAESPLTAGPAHYAPAPAPGASPLERDHTLRRFELEFEGERARVTTDVLGEYADEPGAWLIPDEMRELDALAEAMEEPDAWIPEGLWAGDWAPYRAERFLLFVDPWRDQPPEDAALAAAPDADAVPWPFLGRIDEVGTTRPGGDPLGERCLVATPGEIARLAAAEATVGVERPLGEPYVSIEYPWARGNGTVLVATRWLLPHEPSTCDFPESGDW